MSRGTSCSNILAKKDAQLLACYSSMFNGCRHCGYGHVRAESAPLSGDRKLYPIAEEDILLHMRDTDDQILACGA